MKKLPKFKLKLTDGKEIDSREIKKTIIFFYPKAMTSGCTIEVCDFQNHIENFNKLGFNIIGVSKDSLEKNQEFAEKYNLTYSSGWQTIEFLELRACILI